MMASQSKTQEKKRNTLSLAIIFLLAVVILWLLLSRFWASPIINTTEKVQILDLSYCETCSFNIPETGDDGTNANQSTNASNTSSTDANTNVNTDTDGDFTVYDNDITWGLFSDLNIFEDSLYDNRALIAPQSTNTYKFVVRNRTKLSLDYNLEFEECNTYHINMKYRLIYEGKYLAGDENTWVTFDQLNQYAKNIQNGISDTYYLEWKWFDDDNDTSIGEDPNSNYKLRIIVKAKQHIEQE